MLAWGFRGLLLLNAILGARLERRCPRYAPIPLVLAAVLALDLARELPLPPHLDPVAYLLFPVLSTALAFAVLDRRRLALCILPAALGVTGAPWAMIAIVAAVLQTGAVLLAIASERALWLPERAVLLLVAGDIAALLGAWYSDPAAHWELTVLQSIVIHGVLCYFQASWLLSSRLGAGGSRSAPSSSASLLQ